MIVFDLQCGDGHRFEGWFGSSADFSNQRERGLLACPQCGDEAVVKAPMAPAVPAKGNSRPDADLSRSEQRPVSGGRIPPEVQAAMRSLAKAQAKAMKESKWVGDAFAEQSRKMHYGEQELEAIHGKATLAEAKDLLEEGVPVAPVLFAMADPDEVN